MGEALRECYEAARASLDQRCAVLRWPNHGAACADLTEALECFADLARDSGQLPERMIIRLEEILDQSLPQDDLTVELRDIVVSFSIETYFNPLNGDRDSNASGQLSTSGKDGNLLRRG